MRTRRRQHLTQPLGTPVPPATRSGANDGSYGYTAVALPPGSHVLYPVEHGEQGISATERPHADVVMAELFTAPGVDMVAWYDRETNTYVLKSRNGLVRWERWATPRGELRYRIVEQRGDNVVANVDGSRLVTLQQEMAAAGGSGKPVPASANSFPDMLQRMSQIFDSARAPEFVLIPTSGGDPNHPGAGSHGMPDIVQSRAPLIIAGPGIAGGQLINGGIRHEDIAPTVADLLGVKSVVGSNASGVARSQLLKWQDGRSVANAVHDSAQGAAYGSAARAMIIAVDGLSQTLLMDMIAHGRAPNIARLMARGATLRDGSLADYPTVTWANHNTIATGASPGHTGIVNNSWYDRATQQEVTITDGGASHALRTGRYMDRRVETLYEAVERSFPGAETLAVNQPSGRGADMSVLDLTGLAGLVTHLPGILSNFFHIRRLADTQQEQRADEWKGEAVKDAFAAAIGKNYWSGSTPPKLGIFEFTLVDNRGHWVGPNTEDTRRAVEAVDRQIGVLLDTLDRRGLTNSTAVVLTADHGMEHQSTDLGTVGGWTEALDRAAKKGSVGFESTRFIYLKTLHWSVDGAVPAAGTTGSLTLHVTNDDTDANMGSPAVAGAAVTVRDAAGHEWSGVTDAQGNVQLTVAPTEGPLSIVVHAQGISVERGTIPLPRRSGQTGPAAVTRAKRADET